jgi:hypothetical protein
MSDDFKNAGDQATVAKPTATFLSQLNMDEQTVADIVVGVVAEHYKISADRIKQRSLDDGLARRVTMYILRELGIHLHSRIGFVLASKNERSRSKATIADAIVSIKAKLRWDVAFAEEMGVIKLSVHRALEDARLNGNPAAIIEEAAVLNVPSQPAAAPVVLPSQPLIQPVQQAIPVATIQILPKIKQTITPVAVVMIDTPRRPAAAVLSDAEIREKFGSQSIADFEISKMIPALPALLRAGLNVPKVTLNHLVSQPSLKDMGYTARTVMDFLTLKEMRPPIIARDHKGNISYSPLALAIAGMTGVSADNLYAPMVEKKYNRPATPLALPAPASPQPQ